MKRLRQAELTAQFVMSVKSILILLYAQVRLILKLNGLETVKINFNITVCADTVNLVIW